MHDIFLFLFRISCLALIVGLIKPEFILFWTPLKTRKRAIISLAPLIVVFLLIAIFTTPRATQGTGTTPSTANLSIVALESLMPADEKNFTDLIGKYATQYEKATPGDKSKIWHERDDKLNLTKQPGIKMIDWVGTIKQVGTTSDQKVYVVINLTPKIIVRTNSNAYTDGQDNTLILESSKLYDSIRLMMPGNQVRFSGLLLKDVSPNESAGMLTPEYLATFTDIKPLE